MKLKRSIGCKHSMVWQIVCCIAGPAETLRARVRAGRHVPGARRHAQRGVQGGGDGAGAVLHRGARHRDLLRGRAHPARGRGAPGRRRATTTSAACASRWRRSCCHARSLPFGQCMPASACCSQRQDDVLVTPHRRLPTHDAGCMPARHSCCARAAGLLDDSQELRCCTLHSCSRRRLSARRSATGTVARRNAAVFVDS